MKRRKKKYYDGGDTLLTLPSDSVPKLTLGNDPYEYAKIISHPNGESSSFSSTFLSNRTPRKVARIQGPKGLEYADAVAESQNFIDNWLTTRSKMDKYKELFKEGELDRMLLNMYSTNLYINQNSFDKPNLSGRYKAGAWKSANEETRKLYPYLAGTMRLDTGASNWKSRLTHELTHSTTTDPNRDVPDLTSHATVLDKVREITNGPLFLPFQGSDAVYNDYKNSAAEIYSRLMLLRQEMKMNPTRTNYKYETYKDALKKYDLDYGKEISEKLLNDVAMNTPLHQDYNDTYFAAYGGPLHRYDLGGVMEKVSAGLGGVGSILNAGVLNAQLADTSGLESNITLLQNTTSAASSNDELMNDWSTYNPLQNVTWRDIRGGSTIGRLGNTLGAVGSGASSGKLVGGGIGAVVGGVAGLGSALAGWFTGNRKAKKQANILNNLINAANATALNTLLTRADAVDEQNDLNALARIGAYGGPLGIWKGYRNEESELNTFAKGGKIHIKPENRGKFTALKERTGKSATWFKEHGTPAQKKMATFALNARKWKHDDGGDLLTHGAEWDNGIKVIGNGGTHDENPMEGVPMGMDAEGTPNLVEEGEVIWNDYVFSNRLTVPDAVREKYKLRGNKKLTFADAAKQMQKESEERPNDNISRRGLMSAMSRLQQAQEVVREEKQAGQEGIQYAHGGRMGILFSGTGPYSQFLGSDDEDSDNKDSYEDTNIVGYTKRGPLMDDGTIVPSYSVQSGYSPSALNNIDNNELGAKGDKGDKGSGESWLRYAPVMGAAIGLGQNLFSKPDYSSADAILGAANQAGSYTPVGYTPIGNYLQYKPFDRNFYLNKLNAQANATRRAIMDTSSPSRNAALLAADYNAQGKLGDLARLAEEYNLAQRQAVEDFNRGTNMANAEMGLKAAMANQEAGLKARSARLSGVTQAMAVKDAIDAKRSASINANLTNLFDSLGNIGIDKMNRADRDMLTRAGVFGTLSEKPQGWSDKRWEDYKKAISGNGYSRGGKLKKRRGGLTY